MGRKYVLVLVLFCCRENELLFGMVSNLNMNTNLMSDFAVFYHRNVNGCYLSIFF